MKNRTYFINNSYYASFKRRFFLSIYAIYHKYIEHPYILVPLLLLIILGGKPLIKYYVFLFIILFFWHFFKNFASQQKIEEIIESHSISTFQRYSRFSIFGSSFFSNLYYKFFKSIRFFTQSKFNQDNSQYFSKQAFFQINQKTSTPILASNVSAGSLFPSNINKTRKKPNILKKILDFLSKSLITKKARSNLSSLYLKKMIKRTIKEENLKKTTKIQDSSSISSMNPPPLIYRISKNKSTTSESKQPPQDLLLKRKIPSISRSNLMKNSSLTRTLSRTQVSFDMPSSSMRQSSIQQHSSHQRKRSHISRSLSIKQLKEKQTPTFLLERYNLLTNEADKCFEKLQISKEIGVWINRCKEWVMDEMVYRVFKRNFENIIDINKLLETHYKKTLKEFEVLYEGQMEYNRNHNYQYISINDLLNWSRNQHVWKVYSTDSKAEILKINTNLATLIEDREKLDVLITVQGYDISQIRIFILQKLLKLLEGKDMIEYSVGEKKEVNIPSDTQTLAHIFSNYVFYEIFGNEHQYFYSFLLNTQEKLTRRKENCFFPFDLFMQQINPYNYEPHFQVIFQEEIYQAFPGINNIFCAITLFFHVLSKEMRGNLRNHYELYRIMSFIFI